MPAFFLPSRGRWALPPPSSGRISVTLAGDALHPMTPNLGQGGCTALEDALVLGRSLQQAGAPALAAKLHDSLAGSSARSFGQQQQQQQAAAAAVREAIARYERERTQRCLPLTIRSHLMGAALQVRVCWVFVCSGCFSLLLLHHGDSCCCCIMGTVAQLLLPWQRAASQILPPRRLPAQPLLQSSFPPLVLARDTFVQRAFSPAHFLDHAAYDCGRLDNTSAA